MLKKIFVAAILCLFALASQINFCSAKMPRSEMYLGGLTLGSSYNDMIRIYGKPNSSLQILENDYEYNYGNSAMILSSPSKIFRIKVSANNGWKTPSGLAVGMNISAALDLYGNADYMKSGSSKTAYCYFGDMHYWYLFPDDEFTKRWKPIFGFIIVFEKNSGKILELRLEGDYRVSKFDEKYEEIVDNLVK